MTISASQVAELRNVTGAGMMDCKKALEEAGGDMEKAGELLRKKGVVKAAKRLNKIAAEGTTMVRENGDVAAIMELNSETDFVAASDDFKKLAEEIMNSLLTNKPADLETALASKIGAETIQDRINAVIGKIGEKISLRRIAVLQKTAGENFGAYIHMGGKISVLLVFKNLADTALAKNIAMHMAAANPKCIRRDEVPAELVAKEKEIYSEQLRAQKKPENIIENIVKGKLEKFYGEICMLEQPFILDEEKTVAKVLAAAGGAELVQAVRFELGEGIEREKKDFAAEVAEQMK